MKVLAITGRKGGVGKTTLAVTLSTALAGMGNNVVMIDADTQGSLSGLLGLVDDMGRVDDWLGGVLRRDRRIMESLKAVSSEKLPRVDGSSPGTLRLLPGALDTDAAVRDIQNNPVRFGIANTLTILAQPLAELYDEADYVVIDLGPSHPLLTAAVFVSSDFLLVPTLTDYLSLNAVLEVMDTTRVYQQENPDLRVIGVVPTMTRRGTINHDVGMSVLQEHYADELLPDIPYRTIWAQASWENETILTYAPSDQAATEAWAFVDDVVARMEGAHGA